MAFIIEAVKETLRFDILENIKKINSDFNRTMVLLFTVSIFLPFYISVAFVIGISIITTVNYKMRTKAFAVPFSELLFGFLIFTFFVAAVYNNYTGMMYSIMFYAVVVCGLYLRSIMTRSLFNHAMDMACIASIWCLLIAVYQKASAFATAPNYRPVSVFSNANYYGMIIEFIIIIALYRIFTNPRISAFYFAVMGLNLIGLYLTASFSSFAAMACAVMVMLILKKKYRTAAVFLLSAVVFVGFFLIFPSLLPRGSEAVDHTLIQRLSIWSASVKGIKQYPLFGRGAMAYQLIYDQFSSYKTFHCHNLFLDILLNFGLVGFGTLSFYFFLQIKEVLFRLKNNICGNMNILLISTIAAVFVHGMTDVTILWVQTASLFFLIYACTGIGYARMENRTFFPELIPGYAGERLSQAVYMKN